MLMIFTLPTNSPARTEDDENLARQAQHEPTLFGQVYERHMERIYAYCLARTGSVEDAQDLTSDIFLAALENLDRYDRRRSFAGWLYGIAHHKVVDHYRRRRFSTPLEAIESMADPGASTEGEAEKRIQLQSAARAIRTLRTDQAEALTLRIFAGLSAADIGQIMGKSDAAVKMLVHRALGNLHAQLAPELEAIR
jgi:RNA polymerase sigma-70 factor (ECF subfamily)